MIGRGIGTTIVLGLIIKSPRTDHSLYSGWEGAYRSARVLLETIKEPECEILANFSPIQKFMLPNLEKENFRVEVPEEKTEALKPYVEKRIILGIRPENIYDPEFLPPGIEAARIEATVDVTELMGNEIFFYLKTAGEVFLARMDPRARAQAGDKIQVALDMSRMHAFEVDTQKSIFFS